MNSELDKYGFIALTVIVVLILFIAVSDMQNDDPEKQSLNGITFNSFQENKEEKKADQEVVVLEEETEAPLSKTEKKDYNFLEEPVDLPGGAPRGGEPPKTKKEKALRYHVVKKGDTLSLISKLYYNDTDKWKIIQAANPGLKATSLPVKKKIVIPFLGQKTPVSKEKKKARFHTIKSGDTLGGIAKLYYNNSEKWRKILKANKNIDPKRLKINTKLRIPY